MCEHSVTSVAAIRRSVYFIESVQMTVFKMGLRNEYLLLIEPWRLVCSLHALLSCIFFLLSFAYAK